MSVSGIGTLLTHGSGKQGRIRIGKTSENRTENKKNCGLNDRFSYAIDKKAMCGIMEIAVEKKENRLAYRAIETLYDSEPNVGGHT